MEARGFERFGLPKFGPVYGQLFRFGRCNINENENFRIENVDEVRVWRAIKLDRIGNELRRENESRKKPGWM